MTVSCRISRETPCRQPLPKKREYTSMSYQAKAWQVLPASGAIMDNDHLRMGTISKRMP